MSYHDDIDLKARGSDRYERKRLNKNKNGDPSRFRKNKIGNSGSFRALCNASLTPRFMDRWFNKEICQHQIVDQRVMEHPKTKSNLPCSESLTYRKMNNQNHKVRNRNRKKRMIVQSSKDIPRAVCLKDFVGENRDIWLSNYNFVYGELDKSFCQNNRISLIISLCTVGYRENRELKKMLRGVCKMANYPINDNNQVNYADFRKLMRTISQRISKEIRMGNNVLIHCKSGVNRSVLVVAAYLSESLGLEPRNIIKLVEDTKIEAMENAQFSKRYSKSWDTLTNGHFLRLLKLYYDQYGKCVEI